MLTRQLAGKLGVCGFFFVASLQIDVIYTTGLTHLGILTLTYIKIIP